MDALKPYGMTELLTTLQSARALIVDVKHWTQGAYARDAFGRSCGVADAEAVCWCSMGAVARVASLHHSSRYALTADIRNRLCATPVRPLHCPSSNHIMDINDHGSHAQVLEAWDHAIATLEQEIATKAKPAA